MLVTILDGYSTLVANVIPAQVAAEFLFMFTEFEQNAILQFGNTIVSIGTYALFIMQLLADKIGRKKALAITVLGMSFASLGMLLAVNYVMYVMFQLFLGFFAFSDIWLIYINEEAPMDKRALFMNFILIVGLIGAVLIFVFRFIFIRETNPLWRGMFFFPSIFGIILGVVILAVLKESSKYLKLKDDPERKPRMATQDIKAVFKIQERKSYVFTAISSFIYGFSAVYAGLRLKFLADLNSPTFSEAAISLTILIGSFFVVGGYISNGLLADRIGRKPLLYLWSFLIPTGVVIWVIGAQVFDSFLIYMIGTLIQSIAFWGFAGIVRLVTLELLPTAVRGTGLGLRNLIRALGTTLGLLVSGIVLLFVPMGLTFMIFASLTLIVIPIAALAIKETKGVELSMLK